MQLDSTPTALDWAYLAGFVDGEGTLGLGRVSRRQRGQRNPYIKAVNTNASVIDWCFATFGGHARHLIVRPHPTKSGFMSKPCYGWEVSGGKSVRRILAGIRPHLKVKAAHAAILEEWFGTGDYRGGAQVVPPKVIEQREAIAAALTELNGGPRPYAKRNRFRHSGSEPLRIHHERYG